MRKILRLAGGALTLVAVSGGQVLSAETFVVIQQKINPITQPKSAGDVFKECINNPICEAALTKATTYLGVPPNLVSVAIALVPAARRVGEEGFYSIHLPDGYQYCRVQVETISVVPASGDRASNMVAGSRPWGVDVQTWVPQKGFTQGRTWIEADFTVYGVKNDAADEQRRLGKCKAPGPNFMDCRGATGVNHGRPACGRYSE